MYWYEYTIIGVIAGAAILSGVLATSQPIVDFLSTKSLEALSIMGRMAWITWWALVLGFMIAGAVEAWVPRDMIADKLAEANIKTLGVASFFGFISSSCSYSAIATAKNIFTKGAAAATALGAFMFAATNLVIEIGIVIYILLGWEFLVANFIGGFILIGLMALGFRYLVSEKMIEAARKQAAGTQKTVADPVCGMDINPEQSSYQTVVDGKTFYFCSQSCKQEFEPEKATVGVWENMTSWRGWQKLARAQWREWSMLYQDIIIGFILAGIIGAFVPQSVWATLLGESLLGFPLFIVWAVILGTIVGVITFVCSVGNVPFGAVLWSNGFPFGAILSYIYADLIVPPIVDAYRRYYGQRFAVVLSALIFGAAVTTGVAVHFGFVAAGLLPDPSQVNLAGQHIRFNYKAILNIIFTVVFAALYWLRIYKPVGNSIR